MAKKLFRIVDDPSIENRWHLRAPVDASGNEVDPRLFTQCATYQGSGSTLTVPLRRSGEPLSFTLGDFDMPIVDQAVRELLAPAINDPVQWIDVDVDQSNGSHAILNTISCVPCIDERRSEVTKWQESDERPDKVGQYRMFARIVVDPDRCDDAEIFRIAEWKIALIVSERLKKTLESVVRLGVQFEPVN